MSRTRAYYFGCRQGRGRGHSMHECTADGLVDLLRDGAGVLPPALQPGAIDARLTPANDRSQGASALRWQNGYSVLAWHDFTGDSRPGSNSVFIVEGARTFAELVRLLCECAPEIARRQTAPLHLASTEAG
jgi:hypothetical protein